MGWFRRKGTEAAPSKNQFGIPDASEDARPDALKPGEREQLIDRLKKVAFPLESIQDKTPTIEEKLNTIQEMVDGSRPLDRGAVKLLEDDAGELEQTYGDIHRSAA